MHFQYANLESIKSLQIDSFQVRAYVFRIMPNIRESWNKAACFQWSNIAPEGCNERVMCIWNHLFCNATLLNKKHINILLWVHPLFDNPHKQCWDHTGKKKKNWFQSFSSFSFTKLKMCGSQERGNLLEAFFPFTQPVILSSIPLAITSKPCHANHSFHHQSV